MTMEWCLHEKIQSVCPIVGISFGKIDDKSTWIIHYDENVTDDQKKQAIDILNSFVWDKTAQEQDRKNIRDIKYSNDLSMKAQFTLYKSNNPNATFSSFLDYLESINLTTV